jgi:hypothetical protein
MRRLVNATDPSANLATLTEVGSDERTQILKDAAPGEWGAFVPNGGACCSDVGLMWRKSDWSVAWKDGHKLTPKTWKDGQGRTHSTYAASALLRHTSGRTLFLSVVHLPSKVQNGGKFHDNAQARAWRDAVAGWNRYWDNVRAEDHPTQALFAADWNVDHFSGHWRDVVQDYFPAMVPNWKGHMPPKGTHGGRLIDATWAKTKATKSRLLKDDDSSDHRPYGDAYKWPS